MFPDRLELLNPPGARSQGARVSHRSLDACFLELIYTPSVLKNGQEVAKLSLIAKDRCMRKSLIMRHAPCRNRTYNPVIKSHVVPLCVGHTSLSLDQIFRQESKREKVAKKWLRSRILGIARTYVNR
jgi:hypothetical protein